MIERQSGIFFLYDHQNSVGIFSGEFRHGGLCNTIGMDIFVTRDKIHRTRIHGSREASSGHMFASYFLRKIEISPTHHRNLNYDDGQEILPRPTIHGDISQ